MSRDGSLPGPGDVLGQFELVEELGRGSFGAVFRANQKRLRRDAAVKVFFPRPTGEDEETIGKRFLREVDLVRRLEHPNIVRLYDLGRTAEGVLWMATELVRGDTLQQAIGRDGPFPPERARHIMLQTLSALALAHEQDIVHRDIKPGNIMLCDVGAERDHVKVLDFGIGKALGRQENPELQALTNADFIQGTPLYMAPEQIQGDAIGPYTDVYAAGFVLYEMLVGRPPFEGDSPLKVIADKLRYPIAFPPSLEKTRMRQLIERASDRDASRRFPNAMAFHRSLKAVPLPGSDEQAVAAHLPALDTGPGHPAPDVAQVTPAPALARPPQALALQDTAAHGATAAAPAPPPQLVDLVVVPEGPGDGRARQLPTWLTAKFISWTIGILSFTVMMWLWTSASKNNMAVQRDMIRDMQEGEAYEQGMAMGPGGWGKTGFFDRMRAARRTTIVIDDLQVECDDGDAEACLRLGNAHAEGFGAPYDPAEAARLFGLACDYDSAEGCGRLGVAMVEGRGINYEPAEGAELLDQACRYDHWESCYTLGMMYREGRSVQADEALAAALLARACSGGMQRACDQL